MKPIFQSILLLAFLYLICLPVSSQYQEGVSKIIVYREASSYGAAVSYKLLVDNQFHVKIRNNSFYEFTCLSGTHKISILNFEQYGINLNAKPGNTYYIRFGIKVGVWQSTPELILVDSLSAVPAIENGNMYNLNEPDLVKVRTTSFIGFKGTIGFGINNIPLITTTDGKESSISFGGGYGIGLNYGFRLDHNFDLTLGFDYQCSQLSPYLSNASISFYRGMLSATPSLIIPIDGGYSMNLKLGGGIDKSIGSKLKIDTRELSGGFNDDWKYDNPFGFHFVAQFEMLLSNQWSVNYSVKYQNIKYEFDSSNFGSYPEDMDLKSPDGSGINFQFGFNYNF